jgi:hypothetical protein
LCLPSSSFFWGGGDFKLKPGGNIYKTLITSHVILNVSTKTPMSNPDPEVGFSGRVKWPLLTLPLDLTSGSGFATGRQVKLFGNPYR